MKNRSKDRMSISREQILDVAGVLFVALDSNGNVSLINRKGREILGYGDDEIVGKNWIDNFIPEEERAAAKGVFEKLMAGETEPVEYYTNDVLDKNGDVRTISWHNRVLRDDKGDPSGTLSSGEDITEKRRAESSLRRSEEHLRATINAIPDLLTVQDRDFRVVLSNWHGHEYVEEKNRAGNPHCYQVYMHFDKPCDPCHALEVFETGKPVRLEKTNPVDGITREINVYPIFDEDGRVEMVAEHIRDVTARIKAEEERVRLAAAIEQVAESVIITDSGGNILYVNPAFELSTGYSRTEALGKSPKILKSGEHDDQFYREMWDTIKLGNTWQGRIVNRKKDGTFFTEEVVISPVCDENGKVVNYVAAKHDITEELDMERQLRQAQKMEAVGQLAGGVAHDFNNLLQVINGYTDVARSEIDPGHPVSESLQEVAKAGELAAILVNQLLTFSRRQVMEPEELDMNNVVSVLLKMLKRVIGEHIQLDFFPDGDIGRVHADRGMMEQILMNLCVNARDAMPEGGRLVIQSKNVVFDSEYCETHNWAKTGRYVMLSVTDTGSGMDKETLEHVFEPFFSTKEMGKGTGLGLATVFGIIKQHDGMIQAYSEPGKGTEFKVYLPHRESPVSKTAVPVESPVAGGDETILLAEDDEMVRNLTRQILLRAGYTVLAVCDGTEAVMLFKENADKIDLLILDVVMPNLGGREALDQIKVIRDGVPVLFASGYSENAIHTDFVLDTGLTLLRKPFSPHDLLCAVRTKLDTEARDKTRT